MDKFYMDNVTGEITESHRQAVVWYRDHHEVSIWSWSDVCGEYIERLVWEC